MHPSICYQIYKLELGLSPSEQRAADVRSGELAAALSGFRGQLAARLGACRRCLELSGRVRNSPATAREAFAK